MEIIVDTFGVDEIKKKTIMTKRPSLNEFERCIADRIVSHLTTVHEVIDHVYRNANNELGNMFFCKNCLHFGVTDNCNNGQCCMCKRWGCGNCTRLTECDYCVSLICKDCSAPVGFPVCSDHCFSPD